jgi:23S rRNA (cytosine1962-C5)-methyltransferase
MSAVQPSVFTPAPFPDHALIDSGGGEKLERFGSVVLRRPDPQALWRPRLDEREWGRRADLEFVRESDRGGRFEGRAGSEWRCSYREAAFLIRPTPFKHVGLFPEQAPNWERVLALRAQFDEDEPRLLNLFGYTGAASVLARQAGYEVTHVDASKSAITWALDNAEASGLGRKSLRAICDDALVFARREVRRGARYNVVLLDPPHYGRGPKGETWRLEQDLAGLLEAARELLAERALLVLSTYAVGYSPLAFANLLREFGRGRVCAGELVLEEEPHAGSAARRLPAGFCARFERELEA